MTNKNESWNKTAKKLKALFFNNAPRYIRVYDNGGQTLDRYTIVFTGNYKKDRGIQQYISASQTGAGVYLHGESKPFEPIDKPSYKHLGKRIKFKALDLSLQRMIIIDYCDTWGICDMNSMTSVSAVFDSNSLLTGISFSGLPRMDNTKIFISLWGDVYKQSKQTDICYPFATPPKVVSIIEDAFELKSRLCIDGKCGYVVRATDPYTAMFMPVIKYNEAAIITGAINLLSIGNIITAKGKKQLYKA